MSELSSEQQQVGSTHPVQNCEIRGVSTIFDITKFTYSRFLCCLWVAERLGLMKGVIRVTTRSTRPCHT